MIIPSIDLKDGQTVQLVGGTEHALDAGDPRPIARQFGLAGEVALIDLDAAMGSGSNAALVQGVLPLARCRVGGGIRSVPDAVKWLDAGAAKVILGTAATPEVLGHLPPDRVIAAVDARDGQVMVGGWTQPTGEAILDRIARLRGLVGGFLVTFIEREGRLSGTNLDLVPRLVEAAAPARVTIAGGVTTPDDIAALDRMGADAQVGMALYTGRLDLADAITAPMRSDRPDALWPTAVVDEHGHALGLAYSSADSLREAVRTGRGVYHSRTRGVWIKGETSGHIQELRRIDLDCDRDALRFTVRQRGPGFCHNHTPTCWGELSGLGALEVRITERSDGAPAGSYTARLLTEDGLLASKLGEEARELAQAQSPSEITHEAADLLYFTLVAMRRAGVRLADVALELDRRALRISRRPGDAKVAADESSTGQARAEWKAR